MNKKIIALLLLFFPLSHYAYNDECAVSNFDLAITSGFVWKDDDVFKKVFGSGIVDIITVDACYYPLTHGGIGIKTSYWEKKGHTTTLAQCTKLQEIPLIGYIRGRIGTTLQGYISLGGGVIFIKEKSYLGCISKTTGVGEAELGMNYYPCKHFYLTLAFNALFPKHSINGHEATVGGYGLRAGLGFSF